MTIDKLDLGTIVTDGQGNYARVQQDNNAPYQYFYALTGWVSGDDPTGEEPVLVLDFSEDHLGNVN